jgi:hypothetical protein
MIDERQRRADFESAAQKYLHDGFRRALGEPKIAATLQRRCFDPDRRAATGAVSRAGVTRPPRGVAPSGRAHPVLVRPGSNGAFPSSSAAPLLFAFAATACPSAQRRRSDALFC